MIVQQLKAVFGELPPSSQKTNGLVNMITLLCICIYDKTAEPNSNIYQTKTS